MVTVKNKQTYFKVGKLSKSLEDYLEAIMHIEEERQVARPRDIARRLCVSSSSVTMAVQNLSARGLVNYQPYDYVTLTELGRELADDVIGRHTALRRFFTDLLHIDNAKADEAASDMAHSLPSDILERLVEFIDFVVDGPLGGVRWSSEAGFELKSPDVHAEYARSPT